MPGSTRIVHRRVQTMISAKGHSFGRVRVGYSFRALIDRTIREQHREERRLAEQRYETSVPREELVYLRRAKLSHRSTAISVRQGTILTGDTPEFLE
jgi:hypothetical protein